MTPKELAGRSRLKTQKGTQTHLTDLTHLLNLPTPLLPPSSLPPGSFLTTDHLSRRLTLF